MLETKIEDMQRTIDAQAANIARLHEALKQSSAYIAELEQSVITTESMPGGEGPKIIAPTAAQVAEITGVQPTPPPVEQKVCKGNDLGEQTRNVIDIRDPRPHKCKRVTLHDGTVYEIEFVNGRAKVPQHIADYIHRENPGNSMRTE